MHLGPHPLCLFASFPGEGSTFYCEQENDGDKDGEISGGKKKHWKKCSRLKDQDKGIEIRGENGKEKVFSQL